MNSLLDSPIKPPPPPSELDELISRDPLDLVAQDIDKIIAYQRQQRARKETGAKGKRSDLKDGSGIDLAALVRQQQAKAPAATVAPATPRITPPATGGFRRI